MSRESVRYEWSVCTAFHMSNLKRSWDITVFRRDGGYRTKVESLCRKKNKVTQQTVSERNWLSETDMFLPGCEAVRTTWIGNDEMAISFYQRFDSHRKKTPVDSRVGLCIRCKTWLRRTAFRRDGSGALCWPSTLKTWKKAISNGPKLPVKFSRRSRRQNLVSRIHIDFGEPYPKGSKFIVVEKLFAGRLRPRIITE